MALNAPSPAVSKSLTEHHALLTQQLDAYYDRTKLLAVIEQFVRMLTQRFAVRRLVPLDPYVSLLSHVRQAEISAAELLLEPRPRDLRTLARQEVLIFDAKDGRPGVAQDHQIATFKPAVALRDPALAVWARRGVIERIPYSREWQDGADAVHSLVSPWLRESESTDESCRVVSISAMVGPRVFFLGTTQSYESTGFVELERHVIVYGGQLELAMAVFARQQIRALFEATKKQALLPLPGDGQLSLVSPCAIVVSSRGYGGGREYAKEDSAWTLERVNANRQGFVTAVKMALISSGSFVMDLLFERRTGSTSDEAPRGILRCTLTFFFHFDGSPQPQPALAPPVVQKAPRAENRSFVDLSRIEQSGIFWSPLAANEISRRILEQRDREARESALHGSHDLKPVGDSLMSGLVARVQQLTRGSAETRHWLRFFPSTNAFRLVQLNALIELVIHTLHTASPPNIRSLISSSVAVYNEAIAQLLQDAAVGLSSSLLRGLRGILKELCSLSDQNEGSPGLDSLYQSLQRSHDAIAWLASAAVRDLCMLVQRTTMDSEGEVDGTTMADLRADISAAIEQRRFPPAIVAESVFAQYMVETRLGIALERALVNTVASGLPPNPFVTLCSHVRAFASQFLAAKEQTEKVDRPRVNSVGGGLFVLDIAASTGAAQPRVTALVATNERVLCYLSPKRVLALHQYLINSQVYRTAVYHPSKATYSVRVVSSLIVDDPMLATEEPFDGLLFQTVNVVEHVVIEGKELGQALQFFADAVRHDVARLIERYSVGLELLGPSGDIVTTVELQDLQTFQQLIMEATPKQYVLQATFPPIVRVDQAHTEPIVRLVKKIFVFRLKSTESAVDSHGISVSEHFRRRFWTFGVGFDMEAAQFAWDPTPVASTAEDDWTALVDYTPRAWKRDDTFLLHQIGRIAYLTANYPREPHNSTGVRLRLLDMERALEWLLHRLVFQQQTSLTPRSETAALVVDAKTLLIRVASSLERLVVPLAVTLGMVDVDRVVEVIASVRVFCGDTTSSDSDQIVLAAERLTRRLWSLVLLVRFSAQADS